MRVYDNAPDNYHDELASWFPSWYRNVLEMDALWHTWGILLDHLQEDIKRALDNYFLVSCDEATIEFWENFISTDLKILHSIEYRRRYIMTHFSGFGKCSASQIKSIIKQYTGFGATVRYEKCDSEGNYHLIVVMENGEIDDTFLHDLQIIISKVIPAHIPLTVRLAKQEGETTAYVMATVTGLGGRMSAAAKAPRSREVKTTVYPMIAITRMNGGYNATAINNS
jgi:hypothetical protein